MGQRTLQRADSLLDELGTVVERYDGDLRVGTVGQHFLWQSALHLLDLVLDVVDDLHRVAAVACHDNATHGLLAFLVKTSAAIGWPKTDLGYILDAHGHTVA